jgi:anti-sigma B factor antagonist
MTSFAIQIDTLKSIPFVRVEGEIDLYTCPQLHQTLSQAIDTGATNIVLDISSVGYIDSTGLGVIAHAARRLLDHQGQIRVVTTNPQVLKVFQLSGLTQKNLTIYSESAAALEPNA